MKEIPVWKQAPFLRLIIPLMTGIIVEWNFQLQQNIILCTSLLLLIVLTLIHFLRLGYKFILDALRGAAIMLLLFVAGMWFTWNKDIRHHLEWFDHAYHDSDQLVIKIDEPLMEKPSSYKTEGNIEVLISGGKARKTIGRVIIYFQKDRISCEDTNDGKGSVCSR